MWTKSHSVTTNEITKEQIWKLFSDVNNWHTWDTGIEYATMTGAFEKGNHFYLKPRNGPKVKIQLAETVENRKFVDLTKFPLARMYGEHIFEDTPEGLRITTRMSVKGPLSFVWVKIVAAGIAAALPEEMEQQIKAAAKL
jgi:hypothetical protein